MGSFTTKMVVTAVLAELKVLPQYIYPFVGMFCLCWLPLESVCLNLMMSNYCVDTIYHNNHVFCM